MFNTISYYDIQIKAIMRYHFKPSWMAKIKVQIITSVDKDVEKLEPSYIADGNIEWCHLCGK